MPNKRPYQVPRKRRGRRSQTAAVAGRTNFGGPYQRLYFNVYRSIPSSPGVEISTFTTTQLASDLNTASARVLRFRSFMVQFTPVSFSNEVDASYVTAQLFVADLATGVMVPMTDPKVLSLTNPRTLSVSVPQQFSRWVSVASSTAILQIRLTPIETSTFVPNKAVMVRATCDVADDIPAFV